MSYFPTICGSWMLVCKNQGVDLALVFFFFFLFLFDGMRFK